MEDKLSLTSTQLAFVPSSARSEVQGEASTADSVFSSWGLEAQQGIMWRRPFEETDQTLYRDKVYFYARVENPNSTTASSRHISSDLLSEIATKDEQKIIDR